MNLPTMQRIYSKLCDVDIVEIKPLSNKSYVTPYIDFKYDDSYFKIKQRLDKINKIKERMNNGH